ncbi:4547_t:CDS:2 [Racocetra fulgida]|uniref:4547_t:CDS:1 n=1 Tax=Racocetra fulgida TaxID=60492 RepID=A0A9N9F9X8_9GLOM|nr:4547_t:CDS:2 [Racocetra fulgida]
MSCNKKKLWNRVLGVEPTTTILLLLGVEVLGVEPTTTTSLLLGVEVLEVEPLGITGKFSITRYNKK